MKSLEQQIQPQYQPSEKSQPSAMSSYYEYSEQIKNKPFLRNMELS